MKETLRVFDLIHLDESWATFEDEREERTYRITRSDWYILGKPLYLDLHVPVAP